MKPIPKWLMIPPAVALLLVLGPMSMQGNLGSTTGVAPASTTAARSWTSQQRAISAAVTSRRAVSSSRWMRSRCTTWCSPSTSISSSPPTQNGWSYCEIW